MAILVSFKKLLFLTFSSLFVGGLIGAFVHEYWDAIMHGLFGL